MTKRSPDKKSVEIESTNYCCHGCGNLAKFLTGGGKEICSKSSNSCPENKKKNAEGISKARADGRMVVDPEKRSIDPFGTSRGWAKGLTANTDSRIRSKCDPETVFTYDGVGPHKKILIKERSHKCECCGLTEWLGSPITLELDHIDGNNRNNVKDNLRLLCPNCHQATDTWRGRNKNSGKVKVSDDELIATLSESKSIRQALLKVGLAAKGANYVRCHDMIYGGLVKLR